MNSSFWLELLLRSAALLMAGEALRRFSGSSSAAFRHRLLLGTFVLLAILPILSIIFPEIAIPLGRVAPNRRALVTVQEVSSTAAGSALEGSVNWPLVVWVTGVVLALAPLLAGAVCAWKLARRAAPLTTPALTEALEHLAPLAVKRPEVLISSELQSPLTCGLLRPRIVLPAGAEDWDSCRVLAVLSHELAHVRRRDIAAQLATHVVAALWWFQPLVWMLRRTLRAESELACDAEALGAGLRASEYATQLVAIAQSVASNFRWSSCATGMIRSCDLEGRVRAILHTAEPATPVRRKYALVLALVAAAIVSSAVSLRANQSWNEKGGSVMKRTILSALLTSAGLTAATISGSLTDASGGAIADAKVAIYNPDTSAKQETTTDPDGKFSFTGAAAGQYILRIEKAGLASVFREFDVKAESTFNHQFTMTSEGAQPVVDKVVNANEEQSKPVRVGGVVAQSNLTVKVQPIYPTAAKEAGTQGTVSIEATISKDGVPTELRVISSPSDDLSQSSLEAVRQWRYRPTLLNGLPVEIATKIVVNYSLAP